MLLTKEHFKVGQEVACKHVGNRERYSKGMTIGKVIRVRGKLVTVSFSDSSEHGIRFELEDSYERDYLLEKTNYSGDYELFPSVQAYQDYEEKYDKLNEIQSAVSIRYGQCELSIDQVRRIHEIVNE